MKSKFFTNTTIHSLEDIKQAINTFKSFKFVDDEKTQATADLLKMIDAYNVELKNNAIDTIADAENIIQAMIPVIDMDNKTRKSNALRKRAVYNAVSYKHYKVTDKGGKHEIRQTTKAVTIRDIYTRLCELNATSHADGKVTKADREKARSSIVGNVANANAIKLFLIGAYRFENVTDVLKDITPPTCDDATYKLFIDAKPSKANAEKQIRHIAKTMITDDIEYKRVHGLTLYKRTYTIDKYHQAKIVDALDFLQDFIITSRYAKNEIELPDVQDKGGIFKVDDADATTDNVITF